jgi:putative endonuclease
MWDEIQKKRGKTPSVEGRPETGPSAIASGPPSRQAQGTEAEMVAGRYLQAQGLHLVAHQVRFKNGEIDWIAEEGRTVVFVEVRLRRNSRFGTALESIGPQKRRRIIGAAQLWLLKAGPAWQARPCRFDVVVLDALSTEAIRWIPGAFEADPY